MVPGNLTDHHTVLSEEPVYETRLTHVGFAYDGDADHTLLFGDVRVFRKLGYRSRRSDPLNPFQRWHLRAWVPPSPGSRIPRCPDVAREVVHLVDDQKHGGATFPEDFRQTFVERVDPLLSVHEEHDDVGFLDRGVRLLPDRPMQRLIAPLDDASSIDQEEMASRPIRPSRSSGPG